MTKSELMALVASGRTLEVFTHQFEGTFNVTAMRRVARQGRYGRILRADLTHETIEIIKATHDWERDRVLSITDEQMEDPSLWVKLSNGDDLLIDGTHRILARATAGLTDFRLFSCPGNKVIRPDLSLFHERPEHQWGKFDVRDGELIDRATGQPWKRNPTR